jgi:hypothetical protein
VARRQRDEDERSHEDERHLGGEEVDEPWFSFREQGWRDEGGEGAWRVLEKEIPVGELGAQEGLSRALVDPEVV